MTNQITSPRLHMVDALRGFSLAGVALVHMTEQYVAGPQPEGFMSGINSIPDHIVSGLIQLIFVGKFFALFSILFGLSFFIQMESADRKGQSFAIRFLWRATLLFGIGYTHQLFYRGDILTIYAMLTPFLIPFYRLSNKAIFITAMACFIGIPKFISYAVFGNESLFGLPSFISGPSELEQVYFDTISTGTISEVFGLNAVYGMKTKMDFQLMFFGRFYYSFGYFLIGLLIGKMGFFHDVGKHKKFIQEILKWSAVGAFVSIGIGIGVFSQASQPIDFSSWLHVLAMNFMDWANLCLAMVILSGFVLLYQKSRWQKFQNFFIPYGRMALSNYLFQALIGTYLLFGWGLGYIGQIRTAHLALAAIALVVLQTLISKLWLSKFKYGLLEWVWRCGTHLKLYPLRNSD
ncbi:MAG: DUF418 domain-containing protein [Cyclobacteriaceae bacterium]